MVIMACTPEGRSGPGFWRFLHSVVIRSIRLTARLGEVYDEGS